VVYKVCFTDPNGSSTGSQGIREYISVMATTLKFDILLKLTAKLLQLATYLFLMTRFVINKPPVPTKRVTISLIEVKSINVLLRMLLACISNYLKSVLRYEFLILDIYISWHSLFT
jgi:hypothetical protein